MATQLALVFLLLITLLTITSIPSFSLLSQPNSHEERPTRFEFFDSLQGSKRGDKIETIANLKTYLYRYGYLLNSHYVGSNIHSYFDEHLETAIKTYQQNFNLKITGMLDKETLSLMSKPRCGVADVINGRNSMQVPHYAFFERGQKWQPSHHQLTYAFVPNTRLPPQAIDPIARALKTWELNSKFTFTLISNYTMADIVISFEAGEHGDRFPFDGPLGVVAHGFPPAEGILHFDADEKWVVGEIRDGIDIETVALHEIGHLLGLQHSSIPMAVMYPTVMTHWTRHSLNEDDIQGINALYA